MTQRVDFTARGGAMAKGELVEPAGNGRAPTVVLVQEFWGINDHIRSLLDRVAAEGFLVLAPDLYHGKTTRDPKEAGKLMESMDWSVAMDEIAGAVAYLAKHPRSNGKVGIMGFCMGGALTLAASTKVPGLSAAVPFYGIPPEAMVDYSQVKVPIVAHFAQHDDWAKVEKAEAVQQQVRAAGGTMTLHTYDASHAFVNDTRPEVHDPANAKLAWERSMTFLHEKLG